jgi:hypothetical protein
VGLGVEAEVKLGELMITTLGGLSKFFWLLVFKGKASVYYSSLRICHWSDSIKS